MFPVQDRAFTRSRWLWKKSELITIAKLRQRARVKLIGHDGALLASQGRVTNRRDHTSGPQDFNRPGGLAFAPTGHPGDARDGWKDVGAVVVAV